MNLFARRPRYAQNVRYEAKRNVKKGQKGGIYRCGSRCILCDVCHCPWRQDISGFYHEDTA